MKFQQSHVDFNPVVARKVLWVGGREPGGEGRVLACNSNASSLYDSDVFPGNIFLSQKSYLILWLLATVIIN